jgi:hypothetical protein
MQDKSVCEKPASALIFVLPAALLLTFITVIKGKTASKEKNICPDTLHFFLRWISVLPV